MIHNYLTATRGIGYKRSVNSKLAKYYDEIFSQLVAVLRLLLDEDFEPPDMVVAYTSFMYTETVTFQTHRYLVYDQYLGQVLNRLNRLVFENSPPTEVDAYLAKLFALRSLQAGKSTQALEYALVHDSMKGYLSKSDPAPSQTRVYFTTLQEAFVIAHELAHIMYGHDSAMVEHWKSSFSAGVTKWNELSKKKLELFDPDFAENYAHEEAIRDSDRAYRRRYGDLRSDVEREEYLKVVRSRLEGIDLTSTVGSDLWTVQSSSGNVEECVCDHIAASLVCAWGETRFDLDVRWALAASFLGLHHLRLLRSIDVDAITESSADDGRFSELWEETQVRLRVFRQAAMGRLHYEREIEELSAASRLMAEVNESYYSIIDDQLWDGFFGGSIDSRLVQIRESHAVDEILDSSDAHSAVFSLCDLEDPRTILPT